MYKKRKLVKMTKAHKIKQKMNTKNIKQIQSNSNINKLLYIKNTKITPVICVYVGEMISLLL